MRAEKDQEQDLGKTEKNQQQTPQTRIQPTDLQFAASRETDAFVAQFVMGARWITGRGYPHLQFPGGLMNLATRWDDGRIDVNPACPHYTTSVFDAMSVLDRMKGGFRSLKYGARDPFTVTVWPNQQDNSAEASAGTFQLAICRAALKAFGISPLASRVPEKKEGK